MMVQYNAGMKNLSMPELYKLFYNKVMKIISGGQTGVDQAALDAAIELGMEYGGAIPKGRKTENGPLPEFYKNMEEIESADYADRTEMNVQNSDATLLLYRGVISGGTKYTLDIIDRYQKQYLCIDLCADKKITKKRCLQWLRIVNPNILNIAGPRESNHPGIGKEAQKWLMEVLNEAQWC